MAYFHCLIGGGSSGGGYELTVTCDADFAGTTITCTDGVTTLTQTCPSVSPYEVVFEIPNGGEWTISAIIGGSTFSASIDIPDALELHSTPEGSTVLPTDDIQIWLACAGITDKSYTTLAEVLADSTTLLALMGDDNAVDYLVRSTTWASGITADSTAMTDIGANNYCANTLLADSTWLTAICNSTYFESVLNTKVPTMTSNTTPSGEAFADDNSSNAYKMFDGSDSTVWEASNYSIDTIRGGYAFTSSVLVRKIHIKVQGGTWDSNNTIDIQYSEDNSTWNDTNIKGESLGSPAVNTEYNFIISTYNANANYWRIVCKNNGETRYRTIFTLQFYGRVDV